MSAGTAPFRATRVPFQDFQAAKDIVAEAQAKADTMLADAKAEADSLLLNASSERDTLLAEIEVLREERRLAQEEAASAVTAAHEMAGVMAEAAAIRAEFESLTPWLTKLVTTCVRKIMGSVDIRTVQAGIIAQAVADLQADHTLTMRVNGADHTAVLALAKAHPASFAAIASIVPDNTIPAGTVGIEGEGGLITLGMEGTRQALLKHLRMAIAQESAKR